MDLLPTKIIENAMCHSMKFHTVCFQDYLVEMHLKRNIVLKRLLLSSALSVHNPSHRRTLILSVSSQLGAAHSTSHRTQAINDNLQKPKMNKSYTSLVCIQGNCKPAIGRAGIQTALWRVERWTQAPGASWSAWWWSACGWRAPGPSSSWQCWGCICPPWWCSAHTDHTSQWSRCCEWKRPRTTPAPGPELGCTF